jgi:hypothetical protein
LLEQLSRGALQCQEAERRLKGLQGPELETIIKLYRVLIMKFSLEAETAPELFKLAKDLMRPVMEWARLQEQRREHDFAEQKYRDQQATQRAARTREEGGDALTPETLARIERELKLL